MTTLREVRQKISTFNFATLTNKDSAELWSKIHQLDEKIKSDLLGANLISNYSTSSEVKISQQAEKMLQDLIAWVENKVNPTQTVSNVVTAWEDYHKVVPVGQSLGTNMINYFIVIREYLARRLGIDYSACFLEVLAQDLPLSEKEKSILQKITEEIREEKMFWDKKKQECATTER